MGKYFKIGLFLTFISLFCFDAFATHNRAGEITYTHVSGFTFEVTITTYTKASSYEADRDSLPIYWGDNTYNIIARTEEVTVGKDIKRNKYVAQHTYPGPNTYIISMEDENRNDNVINIPSSVNTPFYTETELTIAPQEFGFNNSPILQNPPIDIASIGDTFIHNPSAFDPDGDSLSFSLIIPKGRNGNNIPGYQFPDQFPLSADNQISLDKLSGDFIWATPQLIGEFNIAIKVTEFRNGIEIGSIARDMQILVNNLDNSSPKIEEFVDTCIIAGSFLQKELKAWDEDLGQEIQWSASGGPFDYGHETPDFPLNSGIGTDTISTTLSWQTHCEDVRRNFYTFVFKIEDDYSTPLIDQKTWLVTVNAPGPTNLLATPEGDRINLAWDDDYDCKDVDEFRGFTIWRKNGSSALSGDPCDLNLTEDGYEAIAKEIQITAYTDMNLSPGQDYCYRITAEFGMGSESFPYNVTQSLASNESCGELKRDLPLISKASVLSTATDSGVIEINWINPKPSDLDTTQNPAPYVIKLLRENTFIYSDTSSSFVELQSKDSSYIDSFINTELRSYNYSIQFESNSKTHKGSTSSNSIFLEIEEADRKLKLNWPTDVPWTNDSFIVYRKLHIDSNFIAIDTCYQTQYTDSFLQNEKTYFYQIQSIGKYSGEGLNDTIYNLSQTQNGTPIDTTKPCPPNAEVQNFCLNHASSTWTENFFQNKIHWNIPPDSCGYDIIYYNIYYAPNQQSEMKLIHQTNSKQDTSWVHDSLYQSISGCYAVTAVDSFEKNESLMGDTICVDNCPMFSLPNVFTPGGDGINEFFIAYENQRFVSKIELEIFNRWGQKVFESEDPNFKWDGTDLNGRILNEGFYFYTCRFYENRMEGEILNPTPLKGWIHLIK